MEKAIRSRSAGACSVVASVTWRSRPSPRPASQVSNAAAAFGTVMRPAREASVRPVFRSSTASRTAGQSSLPRAETARSFFRHGDRRHESTLAVPASKGPRRRESAGQCAAHPGVPRLCGQCYELLGESRRRTSNICTQLRHGLLGMLLDIPVTLLAVGVHPSPRRSRPRSAGCRGHRHRAPGELRRARDSSRASTTVRLSPRPSTHRALAGRSRCRADPVKSQGESVAAAVGPAHQNTSWPRAAVPMENKGKPRNSSSQVRVIMRRRRRSTCRSSVRP